MLRKEPCYSSDEFEEEEGSTKIREPEETYDESGDGRKSQAKESKGSRRGRHRTSPPFVGITWGLKRHLSSRPKCSKKLYPEDFLWEAEFDMGVDEEELIKEAIARNLEVQSHLKEEIDLETLIQKCKEEQTKPETCTVIVLRKKIMQTCTMAIQKETFDFSKLPCIVLSGEDATDPGGP